MRMHPALRCHTRSLARVHKHVCNFRYRDIRSLKKPLKGRRFARPRRAAGSTGPTVTRRGRRVDAALRVEISTKIKLTCSLQAQGYGPLRPRRPPRRPSGPGPRECGQRRHAAPDAVDAKRFLCLELGRLATWPSSVFTLQIYKRSNSTPLSRRSES